jgi:hypothetical protein
MTERLGAELGEVANGMAEIRGLEEWVPTFSSRREQAKERAARMLRDLYVRESP